MFDHYNQHLCIIQIICFQDLLFVHYQAILMLHLAINECKTLREPFLDLATIYYKDNNFLGAYFYITEALKIENRSHSYINEANSWNNFIYDLGSVCAINLGLLNEAKNLIHKALSFAPKID